MVLSLSPLASLATLAHPYMVSEELLAFSKSFHENPVTLLDDASGLCKIWHTTITMADKIDRDEIIRRAGLERWVLPGRSYPAPLPGELAPYYCYTRDGGHSILVVIENEYKPGDEPEGYIVAAPVKTVLKYGYEVRDGRVWSQIPYDSDDGLLVDEDEEVEY